MFTKTSSCYYDDHKSRRVRYKNSISNQPTVWLEEKNKILGNSTVEWLSGKLIISLENYSYFPWEKSLISLSVIISISIETKNLDNYCITQQTLVSVFIFPNIIFLDVIVY